MSRTGHLVLSHIMAVQRDERDDAKGEDENEEDCECDKEYMMIHGLIADAYYFLLSHLTRSVFIFLYSQ